MIFFSHAKKKHEKEKNRLFKEKNRQTKITRYLTLFPKNLHYYPIIVLKTYIITP